MPIITAIKSQKDKQRVNIYLDGKFGFGLDLENFVKLKLKVEQELTREQISEIVEKSEHKKILDKLLNFTSFRPRSEEEIKSWLRRKKIPEDMHSNLFNTLKRLELLDDLKFAKWWVEQRMAFRPKGKKALRFELLKKGIDRKIIEKVLEESNINEEKIIRLLLEKKKRRWERVDEKKAREKMYEYLGRQGFNWETVKRAVDKFTKKE